MLADDMRRAPQCHIHGGLCKAWDVAGHLSHGRANYDPKEVFPRLVDRHEHRRDP